MKNKITSYVCASSLILSLASVNRAQAQAQPPAAAPSSAGKGGVEGGTNAPAAPQSTVNSGANQSKGNNGMAQAMNYLVGAAEIVGGGAMIKAGMAPCPTPAGCNVAMIAGGTLLVLMGVTNMAQGDEHGNSAGTAAGTGFQTNGFGGLNNPTASQDPFVKKALDDSNYKAVGPTLDKLKKDGIFDPKTGIVKIGDKTYKTSDFSSPEAMAAAGFPKGMIDGALAANAEAEKKALAKLEKVKIGAATGENGYAEGGGGGGGGAGGGSTGDSVAGGSTYGATGNGAGKSAASNRDPAAFQGMSKDFNGEPIGVSEDSIFNMMNRRYKVKQSQDSFFSPSEISLQN